LARFHRLGDEEVRRLAAGAEHRDDAVSRLALGDDPPRRALEALGVGDGRSPNFMTDGP